VSFLDGRDSHCVSRVHAVEMFPEFLYSGNTVCQGKCMVGEYIQWSFGCTFVKLNRSVVLPVSCCLGGFDI
jgi:hypothetical protein